MDSDNVYANKILKEIQAYKNVTDVHALPDIFHYWSHKYLVPLFKQFGFFNSAEFYALYISKFRSKVGGTRVIKIASLCSGNCDIEINTAKKLLDKNEKNFIIDCFDFNEAMLDRGKEMAVEKNLLWKFRFNCVDVNKANFSDIYDVIIVNQSLHHIVELELLFDKIRKILNVDGYFLTNDMIGRNGHMRWPEALEIVNRFWAELPDKYKYNRLLNRLEIQFDDWDCSKEAFEGIRAQDILPLLIKNFKFELFLPYGNIIDIFTDRCFGHNFDVNNENDLKFIDRVHQADCESIEAGTVKPTKMFAALTLKEPSNPRIYKHLTPEFCVRWPD